MKTKNFLKAVLAAVLSFGITLGSVPQDLYAVEIVDESVRYALEELNRNSLWDWQVILDEHNGLPKTIYGFLANQFEGEPQDIAQQFLLESISLLESENDLNDFRMVDAINMIGTYIIYVQTYENIPIEHSYILVSITPGKRISLVKSFCFLTLI